MSTQEKKVPGEVNAELAKKFPVGFVWGAATAAYQIEGAAFEDGRGPSIWDDFAATPGKTYHGDTGAVAADHYHLVDEDIELMHQLGLGAYRFSIAWPRILPQGRGEVNEAGLDFYDRLVDKLLAKGITPFTTLYHWDLPSALQKDGGWTNRATAFAFADYAEIVIKRLGDRVNHWMTLNEPWCSAYLGYGTSVHAPGLQDRQAAMSAGHHFLLGHGLAVQRARALTSSKSQVGIALNLAHLNAADDRPETQRDIALANAFNNGWLLDPLFRGRYPDGLFANLQLNEPTIEENDFAIISSPVDFVGINYYTRLVVQGLDTQPLADKCNIVQSIPGASYTEMHWEVYPQGLRDFLVWLHQEYQIPHLYVTENGAAFQDTWNGDGRVDDPQRVAYLRAHIESIAEARALGVPLEGYFVWSLMDNFEWAEGYSKRFGIVYIDYPTQRRIIKDSGHWYTDFLAAYREEGS